MTFTSLSFVCFLPVVFAIYWLLAKPARQNILLIAASYLFYGWWDYRFCALILASSLFDFVIGKYLDRSTTKKSRRALLATSVILNIGLLGIFKYFNFFAESFLVIANEIGWSPNWSTLNVILPVGISFYTFQTLSYTIDIYRRRITASTSLINYLAFVSFFPQLVAGPIERASNLLPQFASVRKFDQVEAGSGCRLILWGFFKKLVIADRLSLIVDVVYSQPGTATGPLLAFATVCFAFQIYCDFSAYSDIAVGTARLFNIRLMRNFAYPYFSQDIGEFWRRWHISLSTWFRDYVYIPLGGSRLSNVARTRNLLATFLVSGFWHGAGWQFLVWGGVHGGAVASSWRSRKLRASPKPETLAVMNSGMNPKTTEAVLEPKTRTVKPVSTVGGEKNIPRPSTLLKMLATFSMVCFCWIFFRANSIGEAMMIIATIFSDIANSVAWNGLIQYVFDDGQVQQSVLLVSGFVFLEWIQRRKLCPLDLERMPIIVRWSTYTILFWFTVCYMTPSTGQQFIYFDF